MNRKPEASFRKAMSKTKTLPLAVECARVDLQDKSGFLKAGGVSQNPSHVLVLQRLQADPPAYFDGFISTSQSSSDPIRKVRKLHFRPRTQDRDAFDRIAELAKIPRPGMLGQGFACLRREARETVSCLESEERQKVVGQGAEVAAMPERWECQLDHAQPVKKLLAERSRGNCRFQIVAGRGHDSNVGRAVHCFANSLIVLILEEPQQLELEYPGYGADLVEEQRPALGGSDLAGTVAEGSGESPPDMAEQFAFQQTQGSDLDSSR